MVSVVRKHHRFTGAPMAKLTLNYNSYRFKYVILIFLKSQCSTVQLFLSTSCVKKKCNVKQEGKGKVAIFSKLVSFCPYY